jgi:protein-disulfide isomerase
MAETAKKALVIIFVIIAAALIAVLVFDMPAPSHGANEAHAKESLAESAGSLEIKALGNPDAPVVMQEFSSFTCGHCGIFHKTTFKKLEQEFIDTGKLYYIYNDFPLNKPALDGALLSRCMADSRFWSFLNLLFSTQRDWLFGEKDYLRKLKQNAKLAGLTETEIDNCLADKEKQEAIAGNMEDAIARYDIDATPTFIIGENGEKLIGNQPYEAFKTAIEKKLKEKEEMK